MTTATLAPTRRTRTATANDDWGIERDDSPGTPWLIFHLPSVANRTCTEPVIMRRTRRECVADVESGTAAEALARFQAHDRGEHAEVRDIRCGRC